MFEGKSNIETSLSCGCVIRKDGSRSWCPTHTETEHFETIEGATWTLSSNRVVKLPVNQECPKCKRWTGTTDRVAELQTVFTVQSNEDICIITIPGDVIGESVALYGKMTINRYYK